jgi:hypothetical protein
MTQPRTTTNVHLEFADEPVEAELRYLNREQFDDTIVLSVGPVSFFMSTQQARQIVTAIAADLEAITTEEAP